MTQNHTKFAKTESRYELQKIKARWVSRKTYPHQNKSIFMFIRTLENYREVFKSIVGPIPDLRVFELTLFKEDSPRTPNKVCDLQRKIVRF